jgi:L-rhamnose mutarotase
MKRVGQIIRLKPEKYDEYKAYHADVWPGVLAKIYEANIRNYTIYHWNGLLFATYEYIGDDYEADMAKIGSDPTTREWWALNDPCQEPVQGTSKGSHEGNWWTDMEEVFHVD